MLTVIFLVSESPKSTPCTGLHEIEFSNNFWCHQMLLSRMCISSLGEAQFSFCAPRVEHPTGLSSQGKRAFDPIPTNTFVVNMDSSWVCRASSCKRTLLYSGSCNRISWTKTEQTSTQHTGFHPKMCVCLVWLSFIWNQLQVLWYTGRFLATTGYVTPSPTPWNKNI